MRTLQDIEALIGRYGDLCDVGSPTPDAIIDRAEAFLGLRFPDDYRTFLKRWGTLAIGPVEIYGITPDHDFISSGVPNAIWYTQRERNELELPRNLIVLRDDGDAVFCLDATDVDKSPVMVWHVPTRELWGPRAPSLFDYIADAVAVIFD